MHVLLISYTSNLKSSDKATILIVYMVKSESLVVNKKPFALLVNTYKFRYATFYVKYVFILGKTHK